MHKHNSLSRRAQTAAGVALLLATFLVPGSSAFAVETMVVRACPSQPAMVHRAGGKVANAAVAKPLMVAAKPHEWAKVGFYAGE
jgi:hypothetical protein